MNEKPKTVSTEKPKNEWTKEDVARIMSAEAEKNGGKVSKDSWVSEVQSKVDKRTT